ncbi:hypothetical protein [Microcoleus sp. S13_C5]|uniref:hypothetical protein n=1 Tax=Microcoleus sp. S13_C5 TaxID=3055411 RepID=UPI002FCFA8B5
MVRAHQHSAGAKASCAADEDIGRSRRGLSRKIPAVVDAPGNPISFFDGGSDHGTCGSLGVTAAAVEAEAILARAKLTMLTLRVRIPLTEPGIFSGDSLEKHHAKIICIQLHILCHRIAESRRSRICIG